jgi:DNA (cytosine-5)-methyltransferase 1
MTLRAARSCQGGTSRDASARDNHSDRRRGRATELAPERSRLGTSSLLPYAAPYGEPTLTALTSIEMCAGAGGQALGLEQAGFAHQALVEIDGEACKTLRQNRPGWDVIEADIGSPEILRKAETEWYHVDLLAGGVPCPPFSVAGKQLGEDDERDLFPAMLELARRARPRAVLIENVRGLLSPRFNDYRERIGARLTEMGYEVQGWKLHNASNFGVPQLRPRVAMIALRPDVAKHFSWPEPNGKVAPTVGRALFPEMASCDWEGAEAWRDRADAIAPTLVGGSKKHGGPDLGPTRAKAAWRELGVNAFSIAEQPPARDFEGDPRLTVRMAATIQGFPAEWEFVGKKTQQYRQVGNAFPPPVARALGVSIAKALRATEQEAAGG